MKISIISFTGQGELLAEKLKKRLPEYDTELQRRPEQGLYKWTSQQFEEKRSLVFIGACGIAVRAIAPFIKDKLQDPFVIVMDEQGKYVIPVLSGHMGGANDMAEIIAGRLGAEAVITTATDINNKFAVDLFARKNWLRIINKEGIAKISAKVLDNETVTFWIEDYAKRKDGGEIIPEGIVLLDDAADADVVISSDENKYSGRTILRLKPREYVLGIGCRRGKTAGEIRDFVSEHLKDLGLNTVDVAAVASIDNKRDEEGLCRFAADLGVPFITFSGERLMELQGDYSASAFVKETVGADNVCERAAMAACNGRSEPVMRKQAGNGITLAVTKREWKIRWQYE